MVPPGVAAGHPATVDAGIAALEAGGNAADAAIAACLASCVAETVMTGIAGGGHAIWSDAEGTDVRLLDFFVGVPGLGGGRRFADAELLRLEVPFGTELVHYAVGIASCGVPGVPAGLGALHEWGRLPWPLVVEPALDLARRPIPMPRAHAACLAMLEPVMTMREGARIYAPRGRLLEPGDGLEQPGLATTLEILADEGPETFYRGTIADRLLALMDERGGLVTRADLEAYSVIVSRPHSGEYAGTRVLTRRALNDLFVALGRLGALRDVSAGERAVALALALADGHASGGGDTTNVSVVDPDGNACVVTTSLGLGSGDFLPGLDVHLNSMLGEVDLVRGELVPGERMPSMMTPTLVFDDRGLVAAAGAAGGTRLRSALLQTLAGVLDEGLSPRDAVARPRLHPAGGVVQLEPGFGADVDDALRAAGLSVRRWPAPHHYFGGVSLVARSGGAGDPRRSGAARSL